MTNDVPMDDPNASHETAGTPARDLLVFGGYAAGAAALSLFFAFATYDPHDLVGGTPYLLFGAIGFLAAVVAAASWLAAGGCAIYAHRRRNAR